MQTPRSGCLQLLSMRLSLRVPSMPRDRIQFPISRFRRSRTRRILPLSLRRCFVRLRNRRKPMIPVGHISKVWSPLITVKVVVPSF